MKKLPTNFFIKLKELEVKYRNVSDEEFYLISQEIQQKLNSTKENPDKERWNNYWSEIKEKNIQVPSFFKKTAESQNFYRYEKGFIFSDHKNLPAEVIHEIIKNVVFYIKSNSNLNITTLVEFGCGNCHNLEFIKQNKLASKIYGFDFSKSAVEIGIGEGFQCRELDMTKPNRSIYDDLNINSEETIYFTSGALEQLNDKWTAFYEFLKQINAKYIFHIEPILEFYSKNKKIEKQAIEFHNKKKYLSGYFPFLKTQKDFNLIYSKSDFGTLYDQGFNVLLLEKNETNNSRKN